MAEILVKMDEKEWSVVHEALDLLTGYELCRRENFAEKDNEFALERFKEHTEKAEKYNKISLKIIRQLKKDTE